jgi:hypothetical protein
MVELLLKDATVHNVERCWARLRQGEHHRQIGDILLTKVGWIRDHSQFILTNSAEWVCPTRTKQCHCSATDDVEEGDSQNETSGGRKKNIR